MNGKLPADARTGDDPSILLNVVPIQLPDTEIEVEVLRYESDEQLKEFRRRHAGTIVFRREGEEIWGVRVAPGAPSMSTSQKSISLSQHLYLAAALVRDALLNLMRSYGYQSLRYEPLVLLTNENLISKALPQGTICPPWLSVAVVNELSVRVIRLDRMEPFVGLAVDVRTKRRIMAPCSELMRAGVELDGLYVCKMEQDDDPRIAPRPRLIGRVERVVDDRLLLTDSGDGATSICASAAYLEHTWRNFDLCLDAAFGPRSPSINNFLDRALATVRSGPARLERLQKRLGSLAASKRPLEIVPGVPFTLGQLMADAPGRLFPPKQTAPPPVYVLDPTGRRTATWHDKGLDDFGPYSAQTFTPTRPRICVICQETQKGRVEEFLYKFVNGVSLPSSKRRNPFARGFVQKYRLDDSRLEFFLTRDSSADAYRRAAREAIQKHSQTPQRFDIAFVQIEDSFHQLDGSSNPYLVTKAAFLTQQIPVQEFTIEKASAEDSDLAFILNTMALAVYAKLGGTPWLLKANQTIAHEFVVGIGSALVGDGRLGKRERIVGITTVFTGHGNYLLHNLSQAVPYDDYYDVLLGSLRNTLMRVRTETNWQPGEHVRLVFHAFKPMKNTEVEAVKALMAELGDYNVDFAFVHVVEDHPLLIFDRSQQGAWDWEAKTRKGIFAPSRGIFFRLSGDEVVLVLTGASEVKRPEDGMPHPILLRLHRDSTFRDTTYLARQVYTFSCHSWRSFFPSPMPVTILYSDLVAGLLRDLASLPDWNPDVMLGRIGESRWFL